MSARAATRVPLAALAILIALAACDLDDRLPPSAETAAHHAEERAAARLRDHVRALPGVASVQVAVALPAPDPFARAASARPARAAIAIILAPGADRASIGAMTFTVARVLLGADAEIAIDTMPLPPLERRSRARTIGIAAAATIAAAAIAVALALHRRRARARRAIARAG